MTTLNVLFHTDNKPFKSEHCDKCFTVKLNLTRYKLIRSCRMDFQCEVCQTNFARKFNLEKHMLTHTKE